MSVAKLPARRYWPGWILLAAGSVAGWLLASIDGLPAWQVTVRAEKDQPVPTFKAERLGYPDQNGFRDAYGPGCWEAAASGWRIRLPAPMSALRSAWRLRVEFHPEAKAGPDPGVALRLNGQLLRDRIPVDQPLKLTIPAGRIHPEANLLELQASRPQTFQAVRIRNYFGLNDWFPQVLVVERDRPYRRPTDSLALAALAALLALGWLLQSGLIRWTLARTGSPLWTPEQWTRITLAPAVVLIGLAIWNQGSRLQVVFDQWSASVLVAAYMTATALWCGWRNLAVRRWAALDPAARQWWAECRRVVLLGLALWLLYNSNMARVGMVDCQPAPRMAISLIRHGDLDLDEYPELHNTFPVRFSKGHWVSRWTPGSALACVPFFLLPTWLGVDAPSAAVDILAKVTASTYTALSAVFLYLTLRRFCSARGAVWLTVAYALGTASFAVSSQDTWQHGPAQFCLAAALYLMLPAMPSALQTADGPPGVPPRPDGAPAPGAVSPLAALTAGFLLGMLILCRPTSAILAAGLGLWALVHQGRRAGVYYGLGGIGPLVFLAAYNGHYFGTPGLAGYEGLSSHGWSLEHMPVALAGVLVSPNRGMFVFSPFLLMLLYGMGRGLRHPDRPWRDMAWLSLAAIVANLLLLSAYRTWHGIFTYGSRYSADVAPLWVLLGAFGIDRILQKTGWRRLFVGLVVLSILIQSLGVYVSQTDWNWMQKQRLHLTIAHAEPIAWDLDHPQIIWTLRFALGLEKGFRHPDW